MACPTKPFTRIPFTKTSRCIYIDGPGELRLVVDYDVEDKKAAAHASSVVTKILNKHWNYVGGKGAVCR